MYLTLRHWAGTYGELQKKKLIDVFRGKERWSLPTRVKSLWRQSEILYLAKRVKLEERQQSTSNWGNVLRLWWILLCGNFSIKIFCCWKAPLWSEHTNSKLLRSLWHVCVALKWNYPLLNLKACVSFVYLTWMLWRSWCQKGSLSFFLLKR